MFTHLHITCCTSNAPRLDSSFARWPSISFTAACFMPSGLGRTKCRKLIPHWWTAWSLRIGHAMFGEHLVPTLDAHIAEIVTWHQNLFSGQATLCFKDQGRCSLHSLDQRYQNQTGLFKSISQRLWITEIISYQTSSIPTIRQETALASCSTVFALGGFFSFFSFCSFLLFFFWSGKAPGVSEADSGCPCTPPTLKSVGAWNGCGIKFRGFDLEVQAAPNNVSHFLKHIYLYKYIWNTHT